MKTCLNCKEPLVGDGRMYPGSSVLSVQPRGIVCRDCELKLMAQNNSELYRLHEVSK